MTRSKCSFNFFALGHFSSSKSGSLCLSYMICSSKKSFGILLCVLLLLLLLLLLEVSVPFAFGSMDVDLDSGGVRLNLFVAVLVTTTAEVFEAVPRFCFLCESF